MNYEKKYKEALERAKKFKENPKAIFFEEKNVHVSDYIFPELKESEDERIRKAILEHVQLCTESIPDRDKWIAWLEKQGEKLPVGFYYVNSEGKKFYSDTFKYGNVTLHVEKQGEKDKPTYSTYSKDVQLTQEEYDKRRVSDEATIKEVEAYKKGLEDAQKIFEKQSEEKSMKVYRVENEAEQKGFKPKFHEGEWITDGEKVWKIGYIEGDMYIEHRGTISAGGAIKSIDKHYHLWTIQDAKDGDVLYSPCLSLLWIFKSKDTVHCGCNLNYNDGAFFGEEFFKMPTDATPATKEQRDLLHQKMHEAGYEWNEERLELKKITSDNAEQDDRCLGWLKKDAEV